MSTLSIVVLTVGLSPTFGSYVGLYADMEHCRAMQDLIANEDRGAVIVCDTVRWKAEPVLIPPPRPPGLRPARQPVLIPPPRP